jgi:hypothetical protein
LKTAAMSFRFKKGGFGHFARGGTVIDAPRFDPVVEDVTTPARRPMLATGRDLVIIAAVYLFFCGYVFREEYYRRFGLPVTASLGENATVFMYGYRVFTDGGGWWFVLLAFVALLAYVVVRSVFALRASTSAVGDLDRVVVIAALLLAFPVLAHMATTAAQRDAANYTRWGSLDGLLTMGVRDDFKRSASKTVAGRVLLRSIDTHEMRLFALSDTTAFVADQKYDFNNRPSNLLVYLIPRNEITHMELSFSSTGK